MPFGQHYFLRDIMLLRNAAVALMRVAEASRAAGVVFLLQAARCCLLRWNAESAALPQTLLEDERRHGRSLHEVMLPLQLRATRVLH